MKCPNNFKIGPKKVEDFAIPSPEGVTSVRVIKCINEQLLTERMVGKAVLKDGNLVSNIEDDILKITVVNRYQDVKPSVAFINNIGIKEGAIAISVNHDSHNIIAVGCDDQSLCRAVNLVIKGQGGVVVVCGEHEDVLPLPVAGIISDKPCDVIGPQYERIDKKVH